jgi:uncharacterized protein YbjT (DUF2867 family)
MPERILVTGAGVTGGEVARQLAATGRETCALVRSPERAERLRKLGIELIDGDFANRDSWMRALNGVTAVFNITIAHNDTVAWNAAFLECAKQNGVGRVVQLSGMTV